MPPYVNPFVPPGNEYDPDAALSPHQDSAHLDWYIDEVAGHGECFGAFERLLVDRLELLHRSAPGDWTTSPLKGQLIVVEGPERSGKTSLVNRMVHAVGSRVHEPYVVKTIDLRFIENIDINGAARSAAILHREVCRELLDQIDWPPGGGGGKADLALELDGNLDPNSFFRKISMGATSKRVVLILLPPGAPDTSVQFVGRYDGWGWPGLLFLAERVTTPGSAPLSSTARHTQQGVPMATFQLHGLTPGQVRVVLRRRLAGHSRSPVYPWVTDDALNRLNNFKKPAGFDTIGWIIENFREIFATRATGNSDYGQLDVVEWQEILEHLLAKAWEPSS